ncbi:hypothetical protein TNIN_448311 [Trichonephila inaurata madagascariensis]|uniref:Uncharacterized protein n=1 Tax=Trichonephila inaurata madagascariensis TaxID=2747483 RepID=A0A8X6XZ02_9ARAC|nr:hypothetical protein TNIN_448311 [Trichonephila inaurata madagascariensis]
MSCCITAMSPLIHRMLGRHGSESIKHFTPSTNSLLTGFSTIGISDSSPKIKIGFKYNRLDSVEDIKTNAMTKLLGRYHNRIFIVISSNGGNSEGLKKSTLKILPKCLPLYCSNK